MNVTYSLSVVTHEQSSSKKLFIRATVHRKSDLNPQHLHYETDIQT